MAFDKDAFLTALDSMSVMELNELVKAIEEKFGVSAAAMAAPAAGFFLRREARPIHYPVRIERSRDAHAAYTPEGCLDFARHEREAGFDLATTKNMTQSHQIATPPRFGMATTSLDAIRGHK